MAVVSCCFCCCCGVLLEEGGGGGCGGTVVGSGGDVVHAKLRWLLRSWSSGKISSKESFGVVQELLWGGGGVVV